MELARRLAADGHRITFAGPEIGHDGTWPEEGARVVLEDFRLGGPDTPDTAWSDLKPQGRAARLDRAVDAVPLAGTRAVLAATAPDLVLIDFELHPHILAALGRRHRVALLSDMFTGPPGLACPPLQSMNVPYAGRVRVGASWLAHWVAGRRLASRAGRRRGGVAYPDILAALARTEGVDLRAHVSRWRWQRPFEWTGLPVLVLQSRALDFPRRVDPKLRHVGPMLHPVPPVHDHPALRAARDARADGKTVIYAGFGSIMAQEPGLVRALWHAVAARPDWVALHSDGGQAQGPSEGLPANVHRFPWVPQRAVLAAGDLVVCHGGINTVVEAISAGRPMLCLPQVNDQPGCAARVAHHGLGRMLAVTSTAREIGAALSDVATATGYAERAQEMARRFERDRTERLAERAVADLLETPR